MYLQTARPDLSHIVLHFPDGRHSPCTLVAFEPEDTSVGIFGNLIMVEDNQGTSYVLNDGSNWIHPLSLSGEPDWLKIAGTFSGELFPEPPAHPPINAREIIKAIEPGTIFSDTDEIEIQDRLDVAFGIDLDTNLIPK